MTATPTQVVQAQLAAYNARDLEAFLACFADEAEATELGALAPAQIGKAQLRERYGELFEKSPALHCHVLNRTAFAHVVIDLEHITGRHGTSGDYQVLAIYEVRDGLIRRVHFVRRA